MALLRLLVGRLALAIVLAVIVSGLLFAAVEVLPGDAATAILGPNATPERAEALRAELDLDAPVVERYLRWAGGVVTGDLGSSVTSGRSTWDTISAPLRNSLVLGGSSVIAMGAVAIVVGTVAGRRPGSGVDRGLTAITSLVASTPDFVLGTVLIAIVTSWLGVLPAVSLIPLGGAPWDAPTILVLPVATMAVVGGSYGARLVRAVVVDASATQHVEAARLAGLSERVVVFRHLLPGVAGPITQVIAALVPYAVGGTIVVERLFGYPGIGSAFATQLAARDVVVIEAIGLLLTLAVIASLFLADSIGILTDPRRRRAVTGST